ncbi:MAG: helix-turn-helix domain-containing protein [Polyangiaceae bacterium]|nr:helix-turn-helix domain-containing protein [Polyangiaceae bacterium]
MSVETKSAPGGIRKARQRAGLSQQRLAELAGCSVSMVALLDGGYEPAQSNVLTRVLEVLNDDDPAGNGADVQESAGTGRHGPA